MTACVTNADPSLPLSDQDLYDYIEPNPDEGAALSECDGQQSSHVSCIKVFTKSQLFVLKKWKIKMQMPGSNACVRVFQELEKVLNMSHQSRDADSWREESG